MSMSMPPIVAVGPTPPPVQVLHAHGPPVPVAAPAAGMPKEHHKMSSRPAVSTGRWTREEHETFVKGLSMYGREWKKVAGLIPTRTVVQIRTHAQKYFQKIAKTQGEGKNAGGQMKRRSKTGSPGEPGGKKQRTDGGPGSPLSGFSDDDDDDEMDTDLEDDLGEDIDAPAPAPAAAGRSGPMQPPPIAKPAPLDISLSNARSAPTIAAPPPHGFADNFESATPRTIDAAVTLIGQRAKANIQAGKETPRTREVAKWLAEMEFSWTHALDQQNRSQDSSATAAAAPDASAQSGNAGGPTDSGDVLAWDS